MSANTSIQWTEKTWNPVRGCSIVSPGCVNCYAMKQAHRFSGAGKPYEGLTKQTKAGPQWTGAVRTVESSLLEPLSWRKPARVFVNSMSDLFHGDVPDQFIIDVFGVMALAHWHTFQILTKRADRMQRFLAAGDHGVLRQFQQIQRNGGIGPRGLFRALDIKRRDGVQWQWPLPNVWLGVSVEDQKYADERIQLLLQAPAAVRFISAEPLLGPVDISGYVGSNVLGINDASGGLDWVIVGGESGPGARLFNVAWARSIVRQCKSAGVPCFVKQLGRDVRDRNDAGFDGCTPRSWPEVIEQRDAIEHELSGYREDYQGAEVRVHLLDKKGGNPDEWPADLRVREFPEARA